MMHFLTILLALLATASALASDASVSGAVNSNLTALSSASKDPGFTEGLAGDIAPVMADPVDCNWPSPRDQYCSKCSKNCGGYYADCKKVCPRHGRERWGEMEGLRRKG
ncbi:hypothetical protein DPSP01_010813 [Paraphaeosphaeria sporulosa]